MFIWWRIISRSCTIFWISDQLHMVRLTESASKDKFRKIMAEIESNHIFVIQKIHGEFLIERILRVLDTISNMLWGANWRPKWYWGWEKRHVNTTKRRIFHKYLFMGGLGWTILWYSLPEINIQWPICRMRYPERLSQSEIF